MGTLSSGNPVLQTPWLPMILLQAKASALQSARSQALLCQLLEDVEPCDWLDPEAKVLTSHHGQFWAPQPALPM